MILPLVGAVVMGAVAAVVKRIPLGLTYSLFGDVVLVSFVAGVVVGWVDGSISFNALDVSLG